MSTLLFPKLSRKSFTFSLEVLVFAVVVGCLVGCLLVFVVVVFS